MTKTYALLAGSAALVALAVGTGFVLLGEEDECRSGAVAGGAGAIGGPFTLVDETGATVSDTEVISRPSIIYFGYTFCPDVCPLDAARNAEAMALLQEQGYDVPDREQGL